MRVMLWLFLAGKGVKEMMKGDIPPTLLLILVHATPAGRR